MKKTTQSVMVKSLAEYITDHYNGNQSAFARSQGVQRAQVSQWLSKDFIIAGNMLYSPRRLLKSPHQD